jgi:uncharacterized protein (TIGR02231 family)
MLTKKTILPVLLIYMLPAFSSFADNVKTNKAVVSAATVFLSGAQLTCSSEFNVQPGINQLIFEGVTHSLDPNSLQATAKGNIIIMDVKFLTRYNEAAKKINPKPVDKQLKMAYDSLTLLNYEIEELNDQLQGLQTEKNILLNNRLIKGESLRDTLELFKGSMEFLRSKLNEIAIESTSIKKKLFYKNEKKNDLDTRIAELTQINSIGEQPPQIAIHTLVVMVHADAATIANVNVSFFAPNAAWLPAYDLRANTNGKIELIHKAELKQNTGMDWNNISLILSTGNPMQSTQKPALTPFYLGFIQNFKKKREVTITNEKLPSATADGYTLEARGAKDAEEDALTLAEFTTANEGMIQTEYDIKLKYTIPNDDNMHVVAIQNKTINSDYKYATVPKMDAGAYLVASITDWNDMNLIPGMSRIYFDGSYIGKSSIDPSISDDTLALSLGKDRSIMISRKKLKDKTKVKVFQDEKTVSATYEITIRNNKSSSINIDINDQIPLSNMADVKIELMKSDDAKYNEETGELIWNINLKPKEVKKIQFSYDIKLPKDKRLAGM